MEADQLRVKRKSLQSVLEQCRRALESLEIECSDRNPNSAANGDNEEEREDEGSSRSSPSDADYETDELCDILKSKVESPTFLEKLGSIHMSVSQSIYVDDTSSWDMVTAKDLWEDKNNDGEIESDQDSFVLVSQDDITEGIGCFIAAYLLSLKQTKDLTPNQLQEALSKTFSVKKRKSKLRKAWDGSQVIYNVASWSATAIGYADLPVVAQRSAGGGGRIALIIFFSYRQIVDISESSNS
ncbi:uncharacterized protein M6B38_296350 [Iris pallida]|uniref:MADS box interactor-like n=1 Tax=Iris pallida TaxID=29817 RepID=A0AAX6HRP3_IRIPA|nr:uncharacterized protein M6B38_296350 [Iris pallida]